MIMALEEVPQSGNSEEWFNRKNSRRNKGALEAGHTTEEYRE